jgi:hypothetical protein
MQLTPDSVPETTLVVGHHSRAGGNDSWYKDARNRINCIIHVYILIFYSSRKRTQWIIFQLSNIARWEKYFQAS